MVPDNRVEYSVDKRPVPGRVDDIRQSVWVRAMPSDLALWVHSGLGTMLKKLVTEMVVGRARCAWAAEGVEC